MVLDIIAAVFGGVSAVNALFDLFKKWKSHRKKKAEKLTQRAEQAFVRAPHVLQETCSSCVRRAGEIFRIGDHLAHSTIGGAVTHFQRTLRGTLDLAMGGHVLDLVGVRQVLDGFSQEVVRALGSLYTRVHRGWRMPTSVPSAPSVVHTSTGAIVLVPQYPVIEFKRASDYAAIPVPALATLDPVVNRDFEHTLEAIRMESDATEFSSSLARDLDNIDTGIPTHRLVAVMPDIRSGSQQVLQDIMAGYAP